MRRDGQGNLIFERMESGVDRERAQILNHALDPNSMNGRDGANDGTWRRRRAAQAMVDAGLDTSEAGLRDSDRIPLPKRVKNFLEDGPWGEGTLVVRADEEPEVQEALGQGLDYDGVRGWHDGGDMTAKARELGQEISDLPNDGHTPDTPALKK